MVQTNNEFQMLMTRLDNLERGHRDILTKLDTMNSTDKDHGERLAALESKQERYVTFKMLALTGVGAAGGGAGIGHLLSRITGG